MKDRKSSTIFLAYSQADAATARDLATALRDQGLRPLLSDESATPGLTWPESIRNTCTSVDYVIVLVSAQLLVTLQAHTYTQTASIPQSLANTAVIAAALDDAAFSSSFRSLLCLDLRKSSRTHCNDIAGRFRRVTDLDLSALDPATFESLVLRLFVQRGFTTASANRAEHQPWDFYAHRISTHEKWFVECKAYQNQRPSVRELNSLIGYASSLPTDCRALLATNTRLTSAARNWLEHHGSTVGNEPKINVIEAPDLTRMLLADPELADSTIQLISEARPHEP